MRLQERVHQAGAGSLQPCKLGIGFLALDWLLQILKASSVARASQRSRSAC